MELRTDIHRRTQLHFWLVIACLVGLSSSCQQIDRVLASPNSGTIETNAVVMVTPFE